MSYRLTLREILQAFKDNQRILTSEKGVGFLWGWSPDKGKPRTALQLARHFKRYTGDHYSTDTIYTIKIVRNRPTVDALLAKPSHILDGKRVTFTTRSAAVPSEATTAIVFGTGEVWLKRDLEQRDGRVIHKPTGRKLCVIR